MTTRDPITNERLFLDTAFLAPLLIKEHPHLVDAQRRLATMLVNNCQLHTSVLCVYELWEVIRRYHNLKYGNYPTIRKINSILKFVHLKIIFSEKNFSYKDIHSQLDTSIHYLRDGGFISLMSLKPGHIDGALEAIKNYDSKPGDSFHYSTATNSGLDAIVTKDPGFNRMNMDVIKF